MYYSTKDQLLTCHFAILINFRLEQDGKEMWGIWQQLKTHDKTTFTAKWPNYKTDYKRAVNKSSDKTTNIEISTKITIDNLGQIYQVMG